jgi:enoyl-CoA hydratase/carnithine racemase
MKKPVIASVQGYATAIGCGLVAASDLAIASEDAHFAANAIDVGLFCTGPGKFLDLGLPRKKALEMIYMGKIIDAQEALRIGLLNDVVPNEKLSEATMDMADTLARKSPLALQAGKSSFYKAADMPITNAVEYLKSIVLSISTTEDAKEGMSAFLEKRKSREWKMK